MQDNTIVLSVDLLNTGVTTDVTYTRFDTYNNRSVWHAEDHTSQLRNMMTLYRTPAKASGNFAGVEKSSVKFTKDYLVLGVDRETTLVGTVIKESSSSKPVGVSLADTVVCRQTEIAFQDQDAVSGPLMDFLSI